MKNRTDEIHTYAKEISKQSTKSELYWAHEHDMDIGDYVAFKQHDETWAIRYQKAIVSGIPHKYPATEMIKEMRLRRPDGDFRNTGRSSEYTIVNMLMVTGGAFLLGFAISQLTGAL